MLFLCRWREEESILKFMRWMERCDQLQGMILHANQPDMVGSRCKCHVSDRKKVFLSRDCAAGAVSAGFHFFIFRSYGRILSYPSTDRKIVIASAID